MSLPYKSNPTMFIKQLARNHGVAELTMSQPHYQVWPEAQVPGRAESPNDDSSSEPKVRGQSKKSTEERWLSDEQDLIVDQHLNWRNNWYLAETAKVSVPMLKYASILQRPTCWVPSWVMTDVKDLKLSIEEAWTSRTTDYIVKCCAAFQCCVVSVFVAEGGVLE